MPLPVFEKVAPELNFPKEEHEVLDLWRSLRVFERSLEQRRGAPPWVFYEGPPTANGLPHNGHVLTRVIKDLLPRYKTMRGHFVPRKAGWDTHGLPVEVEVEKELHIHGKEAIEAYGVEPFIDGCIQSVFRYTDEWEKLTERVGFWVDLPSAYVTYHKSYVESVWWALSELFKKGLLYKGHKVVWWWAQGGTALSAGEVGQGYKQIDDPSVFVAFPLVDEPGTSLLVWTTTPWTLPSNAYAAVHPEHAYVVVLHGERRFVVAKSLVPTLEKQLKCKLPIVRELKGRDLARLRYTPPFDLYAATLGDASVTTREGESLPMYFRVIMADFVTLDTGTGIVHIAPAFGEDDFVAHKRELARLQSPESVPLLCAVRADGTFVPELARYGGRWVKDCDKEIVAELKERGLLVHAEQYRHDYPFCPRADNDPLIQYARPAWYIRTTERIAQAIANNQEINWLPPHIKNGRFGDFLDHNVDWALSRERYWGTPLNIWVNDVTGEMEAPASVAEILAKNPRAFDHFYEAQKNDPALNPHLIVHKPWIDHVTWTNPGEAGTYRRVPEVIDCWFDSGCMPFAQWGFPHQGHEEFKRSFPADFISEAIDQTRGWFYSLLMISTLVFDEECQRRLGLGEPRPFPHPFRTCIVLGHVCDKEGKKESKSKGNYTSPDVILDRVRMEFAVVDAEAAAGIDPVDGTAWIGREELEGLDVTEGAKLRAYRDDAPERVRELTVRVGKRLKRRIIALSEADRRALGAVAMGVKDIKPADVPWLPPGERVVLEDPASTSPGADAFRWFFYASNPPWNNTRNALANVRALQKDFLVKLRNVYSFFVIYANIDGFDPYRTRSDAGARARRSSELDRWIVSELTLLAQRLTADLDGYDLYAATQRLTSFVESLSNWYVRRSRERFWRSGFDEDKQSAYGTLYSCLTTLSRLIAPFVPFMAERMYQNLVVGPARRASVSVADSVHLTSYPEADVACIDEALSAKMQLARDLVSLGLQVRTQHKLKVRQPLRAAHVVLADAGMREALLGSESMIKEELNVLAVSIVGGDRVRDYVEYKLKPNFRTLGQRGLGKQAQSLKARMATLAPAETASLHAALMADGRVELEGVELFREDVEVSFETKEGFAAAGDRVGVMVIETSLDDTLRDLGLLRELLYRIQNERKERGLEYTDRVRLVIAAGARVRRIVHAHREELAHEVLARCLEVVELVEPGGGDGWRTVEVEGEQVHLRMNLSA